MRSVYVAIALGTLLLGAFALFTFSPIAHADSEVLVPSDTPPADSTANLGLQPPSNEDSSSAVKPAPQQGSDETFTLPVIDPTPETLASSPNGTASNAAAGAKGAAQVIKMPYLEPTSSSAPKSDGRPGHDLSIDIDESSKLGNGDLAGVKRTLGFSPNDAQKHCHISVSGMVVTDKASIPYQMSPHLMHTIIRVDGKPSSIVILSAAVCDMLPLPDNHGMVMQLGDKYLVPLQSVSCGPPPEQAQRFDIKYSGDGNAKCISK